MTTLTTRLLTLCLVATLLVGLSTGCGVSTRYVVGSDIDKRVYLVEGRNEGVDRAPEIIGGYSSVEELRSYPEAAEEDDAYGVIWLQFTISASGDATRVQVAEGGHPALETEALDVVQRLEFRPALRNGAPIQSLVQLPIVFQGPYAKPKKPEKQKESQ